MITGDDGMFLEASLVVAGLSRADALAQSQCHRGLTIRMGCLSECRDKDIQALRSAESERHISVKIVNLKGPEDLDRVDAIYSPGGHDIDPSYFTGKIEPEMAARLRNLHQRHGNGGEYLLEPNGKMKIENGKPVPNPKFNKDEYRQRDKREHGILLRYLDQANDRRFGDMPFMGVCYGMQMLAAANGVPLVVHIPAQLVGVEERRPPLLDDIELAAGSVLAPYLKARERSKLYKNHHQAVDCEYVERHPEKFVNIRVTGKSTVNGKQICEVIELTNRPAIGMQFHPESNARTPETPDRPNTLRLGPYLWLLDRACERVARTGVGAGADASRVTR